MDDEQILTGGEINTVTRRGDVVYRTGGPWIPAIHAVLDHLQEAGFSYAPRALGVDDRGREMIGFLPGTAMMRPWQPVMFTEAALVQAATMLRELHEATRELEFPAETAWRFGTAGKVPGQVILHGDLGPWNTLWQEERLTGLIDWDFARPGDAITDLAQLALHFVPLRGEAHLRETGFTGPPDFGRRVDVLCETYGGFRPGEVLREAVRVQERSQVEVIEMAAQGLAPWTRFLEHGILGRTQAEIDWLREAFPESGDGR